MAKVRNTTQSSALRILHWTRNACSVEKQGIQLRTAEPTRKLRRRLGHKSQSPLEATCWTCWQQLLDRHKATPLQHRVWQDPRCKNKFLHSWYPPPTIGHRLQQLAMSADGVTVSPMLRGIPPLAHPGREGMDQNWADSMAGSTHSIPTLVPGMYDYTNVQGAQSTSSNSSLESHMSQLSRTMLQLAQTNQVIANHQQQNHQAMVDVQRQQTDAFNALAAAMEQRKYDNLFAAIPRYDGSNKEECAIWISRIDQLATSTGRNLQMELLNWADGPVMTMLAGMSEDVDDEDIKEELMRCFSNAPTTIQAIQVLRSMQQKPGEQARLYTACYEVLHYRANQLMADEQTQTGVMMFFAGTLLPSLWKKLLKKMHSHYRPHTLREAFNLTLEFEKEYQITQPQSDFKVMETWHEDLEEDYDFSAEVQMKSQAQNNTQGNSPQGQYQQGKLTPRSRAKSVLPRK